MNNAKRIASLLLALVMVFALAVSASALTEVPADTGSILIKDNDSVLASQKTFDAFKVLDLKAYADENGKIVTYEYTVPASLADFYADRYDLDKDAADFSMKVRAGIDAEEDLYAFARAVVGASTSAAFTGNPVENIGYKFTGLPLGYYAIVDSTAQGDYIKPVSAIILDTATPDVEIEVKAEKPPIDKDIDEDGDLTTDNDRVDSNEAAIGDTITYVIESVVPDMTGYNKYFFIMKDTMSKGLTYNNNVSIKVGEKTLTADDYTLTTVVNEDGTTSLKVVFNNFLQYNTEEFVGKDIVLSYTAILNKDAELNRTPNTNKVYLEYSNDPNVNYDGANEPGPNDENKPPLGETPPSEVKTYTTALELVKTDAIGNRLQGAEFTLTGNSMKIVRVTKSTFEPDENGTYWKLTDNSYTTTDPNSTIDGAPVDASKYADTEQKYTKVTTTTFEESEAENVTITGTVGEDGVLRFEGLGVGEFTIKEIKAPEGYNILTEELKVNISWDKATGDFTYEGAVDHNGIARITIVNQAGSELPSTGGIGTTMFYVFGGILVLAAVVLLVTKKRMAVK